MSRRRVVVIGGGISGLAAAIHLAERLGPEQVTLLEAGDRLGGKIETRREGDYLLESGPDCFLASKPAGLAFCHRLGLAPRLVPTRPEHRGSLVRRDGKLHPLPEGLSGLVPSRLLPLLRSRLLTPSGRLRVLAEAAIPRNRSDADETVACFARRRFGREAYDWLFEPLLGGIHAGDGEQLSLGATFPYLRRAEREGGSLLRQVMRSRRRAVAPALTTGFVSLRGGMSELVAAAASRLRSSDLRLGWQVARVAATADGWLVHGSGGDAVRAAAVIMATDGPATADLLRPIDAAAADALAGIPHVSTAIVTLAYTVAAFARAPRGYGYLSPRAAGGPLVACSFSSNKLPDRAPEGHVLLRCFLGRAGMEEVMEESDEELATRARQELDQSHGITADPILTRVHRWRRALPQYRVGHAERMQSARERLQRHHGLAVAGAVWRGVGIPDCIESGWQAADVVTASGVMA